MAISSNRRGEKICCGVWSSGFLKQMNARTTEMTNKICLSTYQPDDMRELPGHQDSSNKRMRERLKWPEAWNVGEQAPRKDIKIKRLTESNTHWETYRGWSVGSWIGQAAHFMFFLIPAWAISRELKIGRLYCHRHLEFKIPGGV